MKILVVDDDRMVVEAVAHMLRGQGYQVLGISNGMDALKILEKETIDLLITDIMMPNLSGLNLLTMLREFYSLTLPVILISSMAKEKTARLYARMGVYDFIAKPIRFDTLLSSVKKILKK